MSKTGKGRIFRLYDPAVLNDPKTLETKRYLEEGMSGRPVNELAKLLGHEDRRVRMDAQFELVGRKETETLRTVAAAKGALLARLHAIWGLGQLGRKSPQVGALLLPLLDDAETEVRTQAAKMLGDGRIIAAAPRLVAMLKDDSARVRFQSAMSLAKLKAPEAVPGILALLQANNDKDAYIRHACVMALVGINDKNFFTRNFRKKPPPVQMGALLAMRRTKDARIAQFLDKSLPIRLVVEAARAINDGPIPECDDQLASLRELPQDAAGSPLTVPLYLRVIEALRRKGDVASLAGLALDQKVPGALRADCLDITADLAHPLQRDRLLGVSRTITARDTAHVTSTLPGILKALHSESFAGDPDREPVSFAAAEAAQKLNVPSLAPVLAAIVQDTKLSSRVRSAALLAIGESNDPSAIAKAVNAAQTTSDPTLRRATLQLLPRLSGKDALPILTRTLQNGDPGAKKAALGALGKMTDDESDTILAQWLDRLAKGAVDPALQLEVLEAAHARSGAQPIIQAKLKAYLDGLPKGRTVAAFPFLLEGGDSVAGRSVFFEFTAAQCIRCHKIHGKGSEVGPVLDGIAKRQPRDYILESILFPNNKIAPGFEMIMVTTKDGKTHGGMVRKETDTEIHLSQPVPNSSIEIVKKADIANRTPGVSAMPEMFQQVLTQRQIRDLVAFLEKLK